MPARTYICAFRGYNALLHFSVAGLYFMVFSILTFLVAGLMHRRMTAHPDPALKQKMEFKPDTVDNPVSRVPPVR